MINNEMRFRQVHLDFHTSKDIPNIAEDFNAEEFADMLETARVDSITCFARCHHGMMYYHSKLFPERVHPNLKNINLLKDQIEACHKRGIRVPIYITVQWDYYSAKEHPEWLSINENGCINGTPGDIQKPFDAGFYHTLCVNSPYRDFLKAHVKEVIDMFKPVDGLFFDILFPVACSCKYCKQGMLNNGLKPHIKADRIKYAQDMINEFKEDMTTFVRENEKNCTIFYNRGHIGVAHKPVSELYSHFELESLPSGLWGYLHFPITMRYARNLGKDCIGMTGKFHTAWGDFHSFKNKAALEFECFNMLALNAKCSIGDQLDPNGKLSKPVYDLIGSVYKEVEKKEPWCKNAKAVTEIGVFTPEEFYKGDNMFFVPESIQGAVRMLQEGSCQFDIIDSKSDFSKYKLLILPDNIPVEGDFSNKLSDFVTKGGAVIASFESGLNEQKTEFSFRKIGVSMKKENTFDFNGNSVNGKNYERADYADYLLAKGEIAKGMPETEHVMYTKGLEVEAMPNSEILADTVVSYFDRTYEHFCSHRSTPSSGKVGYPGIIKNGRVIYFAHSIFTQYCINAPRWCKTFVLNAINILLPEPILKHNGPSTVLATVNEQVEKNRLVVHLLHYIPERRSKEIDVIEDVIPLYKLEISIKTEKKVKSIECRPSGSPVEFNLVDGRIQFVVPEVNGHQMVEINY